MHSPRPYGLLVINSELTEKDSLFIDHQLKKLSNQKALSNLESIRQVKDLPDGGYVILQDMGGILKAIAYKDAIEDIQYDGTAKPYIPMLFSGVILKARVNRDEGVALKITEQCRRRLIQYSDQKKIPAKELSLQRFVIEPNLNLVPEFVPNNSNSELITTQYVQQRPTWYSGAMAEVMQIVGGFGKLELKKLPQNDLERAQFSIPDQYIESISEEIYGIRLPGYSGIPSLDGKFQYDYKFTRSHGITFDRKNKPWLIRMGPSGIYAMPLPVIPATTTNSFRDYMDDVSDLEILSILDRFSGIPSGEGFPQGDGFEAWRRAGVVIKVTDTSDFYSHSPYFPACGWSFNFNGTEGFNTCYSYDNDGVIIGKSYQVSLDFNPAENHGWIKRKEVKEEHRDVISTYLKQLFELLENGTDKSRAIMYKLRRVPQEDLYQYALASLRSPEGVTSKDVDYWDNLEIKPIAELIGKVSKVSQGALYHTAKPKFQPQIKFPSVELHGCISFDFRPLTENSVPAGYIAKCDTIMFGYYIGNNLKVVKYFYDTRGYIQDEISNFEPVMTVGSWEKTETEGTTTLQGHFYTTDLDLRQALSPTTINTKIKGEDKGFDSQPFFSFDYHFWRPGTVWRNRYYTHLTQVTKTEYESLDVAICIPYFNRCADITAYQLNILSNNQTESLSLKSMRDPTSYRYWTHDNILAWAGGLEVMKGKPTPVDGNPVWVEIENYNPTVYSDFADQGSWLPGLPYDITWLVHPNKNQWNHSGGGGAPKIKEYLKTITLPNNSNGSVYCSLIETFKQVHARVPNYIYFTGSPDEFGEVFYRDACKVVFGDSEYANISEFDQNNRRYKWGYSSLVEDKSAYHFIGVINE